MHQFCTLNLDSGKLRMGKLTAKLACFTLIGPFGSLPHIKAHGQSRAFPIFSTHATENTEVLPNSNQQWKKSGASFNLAHDLTLLLHISSPWQRSGGVKSGSSFLISAWKWHVLPGGTDHPDRVLPHMWPVDEGKHKLGAAAEADDNSHIRSLEMVFWQPGKGTCFALIMNTVSYIARESFITPVSILALQAT